jgi:hypothetical protein
MRKNTRITLKLIDYTQTRTTQDRICMREIVPTNVVPLQNSISKLQSNCLFVFLVRGREVDIFGKVIVFFRERLVLRFILCFAGGFFLFFL